MQLNKTFYLFGISFIIITNSCKLRIENSRMNDFWLVSKTNGRYIGEFIQMEGNKYSIYNRMNIFSDSFELYAYGNYKIVHSDSGELILFEDSFSQFSCFRLDSKRDLLRELKDSILFHFKISDFYLPFVNFYFVGKYDTFVQSFSRWKVGKPLDFKFKKDQYDFFYIQYKEPNFLKNQCVSNRINIHVDSFNLIIVNVNSSYKSLKKTPGFLNLTNDTLVSTKRGYVFISDRKVYYSNTLFLKYSKKQFSRKFNRYILLN